MPKGRMGQDEKRIVDERLAAGANTAQIARELKRNIRVIANYIAETKIKTEPDTAPEDAPVETSELKRTDPPSTMRVFDRAARKIVESIPPLAPPQAGPPAVRKFINLHVELHPDLITALERSSAARFRTLTQQALFYIDRGLRADGVLKD